MAIKIGHASIDERGKATGGAAGDQTKKEVCTRTYFIASWDAVLRPKSAEVAEKSAKFVEQACANDNVGYDQWGRNSLFAEAKKVNFDCSKITVKCECDCSSLMHVAVLAAGVNITYGSNGFTTRTMVNRLEETGAYEKLIDSKYLESDKYLKRGDILVNIGSHTVMVLENGDGVVSVDAKPVVTPTKKGEIYKMNTLKKGSKGNDVTIFESIMKKMGYYKGEIDIVFGNGCVAACNAFQEDYPECGTNGKPDSVWGEKCWNKALSLLRG